MHATNLMQHLYGLVRPRRKFLLLGKAIHHAGCAVAGVKPNEFGIDSFLWRSLFRYHTIIPVSKSKMATAPADAPAAMPAMFGADGGGADGGRGTAP